MKQQCWSDRLVEIQTPCFGSDAIGAACCDGVWISFVIIGGLPIAFRICGGVKEAQFRLRVQRMVQLDTWNGIEARI